MRRNDAPLRFALLGHQESWSSIRRLVNAVRQPGWDPLDMETVQSVVPWIPPRVVARLEVTSARQVRTVTGVYIETFITPEELRPTALKRTLHRIDSALQCAVREGATIVSLGGFTSIAFQARPTLRHSYPLAVTTGNTLTAALVVKGVERAAGLLGIRLDDCTLAIIGSTGDVGSGCAEYLASRVGRLRLAARNVARLQRQQQGLRARGADVQVGTSVPDVLASADLVIAAASTPGHLFQLADCRPGALVCDVGYPKNLAVASPRSMTQRVFWGGMGRVHGTVWSEDSRLERFYRFPVPQIAHGCMLEGVLLALAGRHESFSCGRGNITVRRIEEIWELARRHGVELAPLFDACGAWPGQDESIG